jgi:hypothetical protein
MANSGIWERRRGLRALAVLVAWGLLVPSWAEAEVTLAKAKAALPLLDSVVALPAPLGPPTAVAAHKKATPKAKALRLELEKAVKDGKLVKSELQRIKTKMRQALDVLSKLSKVQHDAATAIINNLK